jgi:hypothetical protein
LRELVARIHPASVYLLAEMIERARYAGPEPLREGDLVQVTLPSGETRTEVVRAGDAVELDAGQVIPLPHVPGGRYEPKHKVEGL